MKSKKYDREKLAVIITQHKPEHSSNNLMRTHVIVIYAKKQGHFVEMSWSLR